MKAPLHAWIALATLGSAFAQGPPEDMPPPPGKPPGEGGPKGERRGGKERPDGGGMAAMWKKADTDGDGFISASEFASMERPGQLPEEKRAEIFKRLDKNSDGRLGRDEMPKRPQGGGMPPLEHVDANKDGSIVFEEFQKLGFVAKLPEDRQRGLFKRMDKDGDGALTKQDRPDGKSRDGRRDGGKGKGEGGKGEGGKGGRGPNPADLVKSLDKDGNQSLSFEEFRQAGFLKDKSEDEQEDRFEAMDRNDDLKIDASDFPPPGEHKPEPKGPEKEPEKAAS